MKNKLKKQQDEEHGSSEGPEFSSQYQPTTSKQTNKRSAVFPQVWPDSVAVMM
jgi:hypothetical protein